MSKDIAHLINSESFTAVGLMSGTSMDGIDAALVRLPAGGLTAPGSGLELLHFHMAPYPDELRNALRNIAFGEQTTAEDIATLHTSVAVAFGNAFHTLCRTAGVKTFSSSSALCIAKAFITVANIPM